MAEHTPVLLDEVLGGLAVRPGGRYCAATFGIDGVRENQWYGEYLSRFAETARIYLRDGGQLHRVGEILRNPDMGRTLRRIAEQGVEDFYGGSIAADILARLARRAADYRTERLFMESQGPLIRQAKEDTVFSVLGADQAPMYSGSGYVPPPRAADTNAPAAVPRAWPWTFNSARWAKLLSMKPARSCSHFFRLLISP